MKTFALVLLLSACVQPQPAPEIVRVPVIITQPQEEKPLPAKVKTVIKTQPAEIPPEKLLPPCPPETGDKQKDLLRLLNCTIETADKKLPPPAPVKPKKAQKKDKK